MIEQKLTQLRELRRAPAKHLAGLTIGAAAFVLLVAWCRHNGIGRSLFVPHQRLDELDELPQMPVEPGPEIAANSVDEALWESFPASDPPSTY